MSSAYTSYHSVGQQLQTDRRNDAADVDEEDGDDLFVEMDSGSSSFSRRSSWSWPQWRVRSAAPALWLSCLLFLLALIMILPVPLAISPLSYFTLSESAASKDDSDEPPPSDESPDLSSTAACCSAPIADFNSTNSTMNPNQSFPFHPITPPPTPHVFDWCYNCPARCPNILAAIAYHSSGIPHRDRLYKYKEIAASLPRFFRGCDHLYLQDVFNLPRSGGSDGWWALSSERSRAVMLGDMHLFNFGSFDNNRGELVYDMNDFDQTFIADYHVDLWRTSTSIVIHMDVNGIDKRKDRDAILEGYALTYLRTVRSFIDNDDELDAYIQLSNSRGPIRSQLTDMRKSFSRVKMLEQHTYFDSHHVRRFDISRPDLEPVVGAELKELTTHWPEYLTTLGQCRRIGHNHSVTVPYIPAWHAANISAEQYYTVKSVARRFGAGLGSVGQPRYYVLVEGATDGQDDDVMLDVKREPLPEWWNFVHADVRRFNSIFASEGHRICSSMHALLPHVDVHVGYLQMRDGSYLVRSRSPYKGAVDVDGLTDKLEYRQFVEDLAYITAVNHCRADNDYNPAVVGWSFEDEIGRLVEGKEAEEQFVESIRKYAYMNAERIEKDFQCYINSGMAEEE